MTEKDRWRKAINDAAEAGTLSWGGFHREGQPCCPIAHFVEQEGLHPEFSEWVTHGGLFHGFDYERFDKGCADALVSADRRRLQPAEIEAIRQIALQMIEEMPDGAE